MKPATLRRLHRRIGLACSLGLFMASASGILHVVMTWTQSPPPPARPDVFIDPGLVRAGVSESLQRAGIDGAAALSLRMVAGEPWWRVAEQSASAPRYFSAIDGREDPTRDRAYAEEIASRHLNGTAVRWRSRLDTYDREYLPIFRLLPVHRVDADDGKGTRLYVSTDTGSIARHTDDRRQFEATVFSLLHKYQFIPSKPWRDSVLVLVTALMCVTSVGGIALFAATRSGRKSKPGDTSG